MARLPIRGSTIEGRRFGGPLFIVASVVAALASACGTSPGPSPNRPSAVPSTEGAVARPLAIYEELGMYAGSEEFPAVVSLASFAGPADSTYLLVGLSLPNRALRFQRDDDGFTAEYVVDLNFERGGERVVEIERHEYVRVPSFTETARTDESIVFQTLFALLPGEYAIDIAVRDALGTRDFEASDTIQVPAYGNAARIAPPLLVYEADGRVGVETAPELIVNPRFTVPYGGESAYLYLEAYGAPEGQSVDVVVTNAAGEEVWRRQASLDKGSDQVRYALLPLSTDSLPVGRHWLEVSAGGLGNAPNRAPLLVTISDQWMVANFDEMLEFLAYIASQTELDSLRSVEGTERREAWDRFWERRDDTPNDGINEFRERFFERVRYATERFGEINGRPGWKTDRGEVYIVLGPPDQVFEQVGSRRDIDLIDVITWTYFNTPTGQIRLDFIDRSGFGRYELTPSSRSAFRNAAARLRPSS